MAHIKVSDILAKASGACFSLASEREAAFERYEHSFRRFAEKLNMPSEDIFELVQMQGSGKEPFYPVTFRASEHGGKKRFSMMGTFSKLETVLDDSGLSLTLYVTKYPQTFIASPFTKPVVFDHYKTLFPGDLVEDNWEIKKTSWNFQRAVIAMTMCENKYACSELYDQWPGYGEAQNVMRCMPQDLLPRGEGRIPVLHIDGAVLQMPLLKIGEVRARISRAPSQG